MAQFTGIKVFYQQLHGNPLATQNKMQRFIEILSIEIVTNLQEDRLWLAV